MSRRWPSGERATNVWTWWRRHYATLREFWHGWTCLLVVVVFVLFAAAVCVGLGIGGGGQ